MSWHGDGTPCRVKNKDRADPLTALGRRSVPPVARGAGRRAASVRCPRNAVSAPRPAGQTDPMAPTGAMRLPTSFVEGDLVVRQWVVADAPRLHDAITASVEHLRP